MNMFCNNLMSTTNADACRVFLKHMIRSRGYHYSMYLLSGEKFQNKVKLDWPPPFQEDDSNVFILGSCINGIVCLFRFDHITVVLWNPATHEFKLVPSDLIQPPPDYSTSAILHGFGYDHVQDDYKIIRSVNILPYHKFQRKSPDMKTRPNILWQIYSLRKNIWRKLNVNITIRRHSGSGVGFEVYLNGVCHWFGTIDNKEPFVVSFNLSSEVFFITPFPLEYVHGGFRFGSWNNHLVVLNESIAMISKDEKAYSLHIYILGEVGVKNSWTKLFIVGPLPCLDFLIGAGKTGDIFFRKQDDELAYVDISTQKVEEIGAKGGLFFCHIGIYKENLQIGCLNN